LTFRIAAAVATDEPTNPSSGVVVVAILVSNFAVAVFLFLLWKKDRPGENAGAPNESQV
jgi:hypothetical protein